MKFFRHVRVNANSHVCGRAWITRISGESKDGGPYESWVFMLPVFGHEYSIYDDDYRWMQKGLYIPLGNYGSLRTFWTPP